MTDNKLIPNTFQHPNAYIDWLAYYLTPEEEKVLNKAIREILGWSGRIESRQARIALSVFEKGKVHRETGERLCMGCGLGIAAIRKALRALDEYKILVRVGDPTNDGQMYHIQDNYQQVDLDGLKDRRTCWDAKNESRTSKARVVMSDKRGIVAHNPPPIVAHNPGGIVGQHERNPKEIQKETKNHTPPGVVLPNGMTEDVLFGLMDFHKCDEQQAVEHWCRLNEQKPQEPAQPVKLDFLTHTAEQAGRLDDPLWFIRPGTPCGDHDYLEPLQAFCAVIRRSLESLGEKKTMQWLRELENIGTKEAIKVGPGLMASTIKAMRGDWAFQNDVWLSPFADKFGEKVRTVADRIRQGESGSPTQTLEIRGRWQ